VSPLCSRPFLFDQQKAEEEEGEDKSDGHLAANFFLAQEKPEEVKAEIEDDEMIEKAHCCLDQLI
jgi:hypothetical protein